MGSISADLVIYAFDYYHFDRESKELALLNLPLWIELYGSIPRMLEEARARRPRVNYDPFTDDYYG